MNTAKALNEIAKRIKGDLLTHEAILDAYMDKTFINKTHEELTPIYKVLLNHEESMAKINSETAHRLEDIQDLINSTVAYLAKENELSLAYPLKSIRSDYIDLLQYEIKDLIIIKGEFDFFVISSNQHLETYNRLTFIIEAQKEELSKQTA